MTATWRAFWDGDHPIYVSDRHREVHYRAIADGVLGELRALGPRATPVVLDYACGDALEASRVAAGLARLVLCDGAPSVVDKLKARHAGDKRIVACLPEDLDRALADGAADLIVVSSLIQYLTRSEFEALLDRLRAKLARDGRLVVADVIPPDAGMAADVASLLRNGLSHGFFLAALAGLAATVFSPYRKMRQTLGLTAYGEADMLAIMSRHGLVPTCAPVNLGLTPHRRTYVATWKPAN